MDDGGGVRRAYERRMRLPRVKTKRAKRPMPNMASMAVRRRAPQALRDIVCPRVHRRPSSHLRDTGKGSEKTEVLPSASVAVAVM